MSAFFDFEQLEWTQAAPTARRKVVHEGDLMFVLFELKAGAGPSLHSHPHTQMATVLRGRIEAAVGGEKRIIGPMGGYRVPPNVPHGVRVLGDEDALVLDCFTPIREDFLQERGR